MRVVVALMSSENHGIGTLDGWRHDIGVAAKLRASEVYSLVHGTTLEEVVRLVVPLPALKKEKMPAISSDDLWCDTVNGPAYIAAASPFSQWQLAKKSESAAVNPFARCDFSPTKQRSMHAPLSIIA